MASFVDECYHCFIVFLTIFNNLSELTQSSVLDDLLGNHDADADQKVRRYSNIIAMILMR